MCTPAVAPNAVAVTSGRNRAKSAGTPEAVADATAKALAAGRHTVWVPGTLRFVFAILRHLPRALYRRLPL